MSTDAQQKEGAIESQVLELKRQIAAAGDVLVKQYADDGYSGTLLDRPALEALRRDVRTPLFDVVYFLDTDRIARDIAYQTIILGELLKYGIRKTATAPAALIINEEQAPVVRSIFEMFASGRFGLVTISRSLEERRVPTRLGRPLWHRDQIKAMLKNETYAGTRYFNRMTRATEAPPKGRQVIRGRWVYRDRSEWVPVKVPAIVPRELFETVHERLRLRGALLPARHPLPPAGPGPMRRVRQPLFFLSPLPQGRAPIGEALRLSSGRVPVQSARPREHAR